MVEVHVLTRKEWIEVGGVGWGAARASLPGEDESDAAFMPCTMLSVNFCIFFSVYHDRT